MELQFTLSAIGEAVQQLWQAGKDRTVWAFHGEMGAGKTTVIHALCEMLGVTSAIGSPTYSISNEYHSAIAGTIHHMDWYRLKDEEEALQAGVEDALYSNNVCFVEWPERASGLLPMDTFHIRINLISAQQRVLQFD